MKIANVSNNPTTTTEVAINIGVLFLSCVTEPVSCKGEGLGVQLRSFMTVRYIVKLSVMVSLMVVNSVIVNINVESSIILGSTISLL